MRITPDFVFFWDGPLSNFSGCYLKHDNKNFVSSEQIYMWYKAMFFKDEETAALILATASPKEAKNLGRKVKGFIQSEWDTVKYERMKTACMEKYTQSIFHQEELLKYYGKTFVEASPYDAVWGIAMGEDHPDVLDPTKWKGENLLGKVLTEICSELACTLAPNKVKINQIIEF